MDYIYTTSYIVFTNHPHVGSRLSPVELSSRLTLILVHPPSVSIGPAVVTIQTTPFVWVRFVATVSTNHIALTTLITPSCQMVVLFYRARSAQRNAALIAHQTMGGGIGTIVTEHKLAV